MPIIGSTIGEFLSLQDTPSSYSGYANYFIKVNATEDGLEFSLSSSSSGNFSYNVVDTSLTISAKQQMIVYQNIELNADLILNGDLVLIN